MFEKLLGKIGAKMAGVSKGKKRISSAAVKLLPPGPNKRVFVVGAEPAFRGALTRLFVQTLVEPQSCYSP